MHLGQVHLENLHPALDIRRVDLDLPIEATGAQQCLGRVRTRARARVRLRVRIAGLGVRVIGAQQCRVEHVGPVGARHDHDVALVRVRARVGRVRVVGWLRLGLGWLGLGLGWLGLG